MLELPGVSQLHADGETHIRFEYRGDMEPLMRALGRAEVLEFLSEPESLTEAFFDIYGER
jgi:hypothetical protein